METPASDRPKLAEVIRLLEQRPFHLLLWQDLETAVRTQGDPFSLKTLAVVIKGIKAINGKQPDSRPIRETFTRLVRSYNNPVVIRAAAKHYLVDFHLPEVAKEHLLHCRALGINDNELNLLLTQCEVELRRFGSQLLAVTNSDAGRSITRTGKMSLMPKAAASAPVDRRADAVAAAQLEAVPNERLTAQAAACLVSGDLVSARRFLKRGLPDTDPARYWELWTELGAAHYEKNQFLDARSAYNEACTIAPDFMVSQFNLGTAKLLSGDFAGALACFERADQIEGMEPKVLCNKGAAYFLQDNHAAAERVLRETIAIRPDYVRALNTLASVLGALNRLDESVEMCDRVLELAPGHPEASLKKGIVCLNRGQAEEAIEHLSNATANPALQMDAQAYLAQALAASHSPDEAEELFVSTLGQGQLDQDIIVATWKTIGRSWRQQEDINRAVAAFQQICEIAPRDSEAWYELGFTYANANHESYARECFQTYLRLKPDAGRRTTVDGLLEMSRHS